MTTISQEEENYVRISLLLSGISRRAVQALFDGEFDPSCLAASIKKAYNKLKKLKQRNIINQSQWNLLFAQNGGQDSSRFDVTLMILLLTNLTKLNHYENLPMATDTTPSADLARIKYYRNHISHHAFHNENGKLDSLYFNKAWDNISGAVGRLGGQEMHDECIKLKTISLDQKTVPWNIRVQFKQNLDQWQKNTINFVETRAAKHVFTCIQANSCVTITASSGVGKTATLQHVSLQMIDEGYDILPITNPNDIVNFYNPNQKTLFVVDDFCGTYSINAFDLNIWENIMDRIAVLIQNKLTKLIVACRLQVYQDEKFGSLSMFKASVCYLLSEDLCLLETEKQSIAELYLGEKATDIIKYCNLYDCFPLLCKLYSDDPKPNLIDFFLKPFSVYAAEIGKLKKGKFC